MVKNNNEYVKKLKREEKINGWLIDDIGIKYLIEPKKIYNEIIAWIFMISAIILIVVSCFAYESETGMKKLTDSMLYGTEKLNKKKWGVSIVITTLAFVIANVPSNISWQRALTISAKVWQMPLVRVCGMSA